MEHKQDGLFEMKKAQLQKLVYDHSLNAVINSRPLIFSMDGNVAFTSRKIYTGTAESFLMAYIRMYCDYYVTADCDCFNDTMCVHAFAEFNVFSESSTLKALTVYGLLVKFLVLDIYIYNSYIGLQACGSKTHEIFGGLVHA
jgi:hypothetical protein